MTDTDTYLWKEEACRLRLTKIEGQESKQQDSSVPPTDLSVVKPVRYKLSLAPPQGWDKSSEPAIWDIGSDIDRSTKAASLLSISPSDQLGWLKDASLLIPKASRSEQLVPGETSSKYTLIGILHSRWISWPKSWQRAGCRQRWEDPYAELQFCVSSSLVITFCMAWPTGNKPVLC